MNTIRFPLTVLVALLIVMVAEFVYFYPLLPERVASHFDADGVANGWTSKGALVIIMGIVTLMAVGSTAGFALLLSRMQDSINIPNKTYWLAPERRDETLGFIGAHMVWIACAVLSLLIVVNYFVCSVNIDGSTRLGLPMIPTLAVFFVVLGIIITRMLLKFRTTT